MVNIGRRCILLTATCALVATGLAAPLSASAVTGGTISGHVLDGSQITLYSAQTDAVVQTTTTWLTNTFSFTNLPPGDYKVGFVKFNDPYLLNIPKVPEFWDNSPTLAGAQVLTIVGSETISGIDPVLVDEIPSIAGTLSAFDPIAPGGNPQCGNPAGAREILVYGSDGAVVTPSQVRLEFDCSYRIWGLPAGSYYVSARIGYYSQFATTYLGSVPLISQSETVAVVDGVTTAATTITLPLAGRMYGPVTNASTGVGLEASEAEVELFYFNSGTGDFEPLVYSGGIYGGTFQALGLWPGRYLVRFRSTTDEWLGPEWWSNARVQADATEVIVTAGSIADVGAALDPYTFFVDRVHGADRYATNVEISKVMFPASDGPHQIPVLYVANGTNYPDALSAGPAAAHQGGGLLLVSRDFIPTVVLNEIDRLNPINIVVVGGPGAVSEGVLAQLAAYAENPPIRVSGADRYETSRAVVSHAFACSVLPCASAIFVATGSNFPDALAAGPAASYLDAPVILVPGRSSSIDAETETLIASLGVTSGYIAGGAGVVSASLESSLNSIIATPMVRLAGANRYQTAQKINAEIFGISEAVFVATGSGFADALSGGPLAAKYGAPLFLSPQSCMQIELVGAAIELEADYLVLLGGTASLSESVENLTLC